MIDTSEVEKEIARRVRPVTPPLPLGEPATVHQMMITYFHFADEAELPDAIRRRGFIVNGIVTYDPSETFVIEPGMQLKAGMFIHTVLSQEELEDRERAEQYKQMMLEGVGNGN
jgi:hypothetical protein